MSKVFGVLSRAGIVENCILSYCGQECRKSRDTYNGVRPWLHHPSGVGPNECHRCAVPIVHGSALRHKCRLVPGLWAGASLGLVLAHESHLSKQHSLEIGLCPSQGLKASSSISQGVSLSIPPPTLLLKMTAKDPEPQPGVLTRLRPGGFPLILDHIQCPSHSGSPIYRGASEARRKWAATVEMKDGQD